MIDLLKVEKDFILPHIKQGGICVDFTCGNGNDTLFLSKEIGENGKVYAFDIQKQAIDNTKALLEKNGSNNVELILDSHSNVKKYVKDKICVGMFNLGFLPGSNKEITTMRDTTLEAIISSLELLDKDGAILIAVYPGHEEGEKEGEMIREYLSFADRRVYCVSCFKIINSPTSPFFYLIEKSPTREKEKIAVSACILGDNVRYDGKSKPIELSLIQKLRIRYEIIRVCPETFGGLTRPRDPSEQKDGKVISKSGLDVTENFNLGAEKTLNIIKCNNITKAIMKKRSPSCGMGEIYDGTFSKTLIKGNGIATDLLLKNGIKVYNEDDIENLIK